MARRWWKSGRLKPGVEVKEPGSVLHFDRGWISKMVINAIGAVTTCVVMIIFAVTKFLDGAWIIVILTPLLIIGFYTIHRHYRGLARQLSLEEYGPRNLINHNRVIMPISSVHSGTLAALRYARTLSDDVTVVHVSIDPHETEKLKDKWDTWGDGYRLVILESPYRLLIEPLLEYLDKINAVRRPNEMITIVVPQFVPRNTWTNLLHTRTANILRNELLFQNDVVIIEVPYQVT